MTFSLRTTCATAGLLPRNRRFCFGGRGPVAPKAGEPVARSAEADTGAGGYKTRLSGLATTRMPGAPEAGEPVARSAEADTGAGGYKRQAVGFGDYKEGGWPEGHEAQLSGCKRLSRGTAVRI